MNGNRPDDAQPTRNQLAGDMEELAMSVLKSLDPSSPANKIAWAQAIATLALSQRLADLSDLLLTLTEVSN
jgi:hypothetical protein